MNRRSLIALLVVALSAFAQPVAPDITGNWQGALEAGGTKLRLALDISKTSEGLYTGKLTSIDQGGAEIPLDSVKLTGNALRLEAKAIDGTYEASLDSAGAKMTGTWTQAGHSLPLEFTRSRKQGEAKPAQ